MLVSLWTFETPALKHKGLKLIFTIKDPSLPLSIKVDTDFIHVIKWLRPSPSVLKLQEESVETSLVIKWEMFAALIDFVLSNQFEADDNYWLQNPWLIWNHK